MNNPFSDRDPKVKYFLVDYLSDLNEGRGFQETGLIMVEADKYHRDFAEHWCYKKFGSRIEFVMGAYTSSAITENWRVRTGYREHVEDFKLLAVLKDEIVGG